MTSDWIFRIHVCLATQFINYAIRNMEKYRTKDIAEAGALIVHEQRLVSVDRQEHVCWFVFENTQECKNLTQLFYFDELLVSVRSYHEALKRLKSLIFMKQK